MAEKPVSLVKALADALRRGVTGAIVSAGKAALPRGGGLADARSGTPAPVRKVWVRGGEVLFIDSAEPKDRYTQILARHGALTKTEVLLIEEEFSGPGIGEEKAILASDMMTAGELAEYAGKVLEERLLSAFELPGAIWSVMAGEIPRDLPEHPMPLALAVVRGIRERYPLDRLKLEFPLANDDHYTFQPEEQRKLGLTLSPVEEKVAAALDGENDWSEVLEETKLAPKDACAALFAMSVLGIATYAGNAAPTRAAGSGRIAAPLAASTASGRAQEMRDLAARELPDLLSVPPEAAVTAVQQAFKALVAKYDLGRAHALPDSDRVAALALLDRAADAYLVMTHPKSREKYFEAAPLDRETIAVGLALDLAAEKHYLKAGIFLQAGNYLGAEAALLPALQLNPRESRFHLRMGIAIYQRAKARGDGSAIPSGAARALEKAAAFDQKNFEPWLYLGHIAMHANDRQKAHNLYAHALELNPSSDEAKRALQRAESR